MPNNPIIRGTTEGIQKGTGAVAEEAQQTFKAAAAQINPPQVLNDQQAQDAAEKDKIESEQGIEKVTKELREYHKKEYYEPEFQPATPLQKPQIDQDQEEQDIKQKPTLPPLDSSPIPSSKPTRGVPAWQAKQKRVEQRKGIGG